jgi:hypothetical protein
MFNDFFDKYAFKLTLEHTAPKIPVSGSCLVQPLDNYCRQQVKC